MLFKGWYGCFILAFIGSLASNPASSQAYTYQVSGQLPPQMAAYSSPINITVTITNISGGTYGLGAGIQGDKNWVPGANTCVLTQALANGASCQIQGEFNPQYVSQQSSLSLAVTIYPGVTIKPVVLMQTSVTPHASLSITPVPQTESALYSELQVTNNATFAQSITLTNNTSSNLQELMPCTYANGLNQCPSCQAITSTGIATSTAVLALAFDPNHQRLYVGGSFNAAGGIPSAFIAYWDTVTQTWSSVPGLDGAVNALAYGEVNNILYAGGRFTNHIASWEGHTWTTLGTTGLNSNVNALSFDALTSSGRHVMIGGAFTRGC